MNKFDLKEMKVAVGDTEAVKRDSLLEELDASYAELRSIEKKLKKTDKQIESHSEIKSELRDVFRFSK